MLEMSIINVIFLTNVEKCGRSCKRSLLPTIKGDRLTRRASHRRVCAGARVEWVLDSEVGTSLSSAHSSRVGVHRRHSEQSSSKGRRHSKGDRGDRRARDTRRSLSSHRRRRSTNVGQKFAGAIFVKRSRYVVYAASAVYNESSTLTKQ